MAPRIRRGASPTRPSWRCSDVARGHGIHRLDTAPGVRGCRGAHRALAPGFGVQTKVSARAAARQITSAPPSRRACQPWVGPVSMPCWFTTGRLWMPEARRRVAKRARGAAGRGLVAAVGVSGYEEADVASALAAFGTLDVVQVPVSVLDQRLDGSRLLAEVRDRGGRVQARSILLQGAALAGAGASPLRRPSRCRAAPGVRAIPLALCLGFVASRDWVDEVVLAATSAEELASSWSCWSHR